MKALLLVALNCCLYGGEAAALLWDDFDLTAGTLAGARGKTGILRVSVLWPETVQALRRLPATSPAVFVTATGSQADYLSIQRQFLSLREAAKRPKVQLAQIRDGAYTAAVQAGIPLDQ